MHIFAAAKERRPIDLALSNFQENDYIDTGRYMWQIKDFLKCYPLERFLIVVLDELYEQPQTVMAEIFRFLGVDEEYCHGDYSQLYHEGRQKMHDRNFVLVLRKIPGLSYTAKRLIPYDWFRRLGKYESNKPQHQFSTRY